MSINNTKNATTYNRCEAQRCDAQAAGRCARCGMLLCAACLARHARYPGVAVTSRHQRQREEESKQS